VQYQIERITQRHDRSSFRSGEVSLDDYLARHARQNDELDLSRAFVLVASGETIVRGYFTLTAGEIDRGDVPVKLKKKLPQYPVPVVMLGRLAVDQSLRGQGFGSLLLREALRNSLVAAESIGLMAVVVDAINKDALDFYRHFGFIPFLDRPNKLFLGMSTVRSLVGGDAKTS
jgi:GNAT superfamily N-acetyltransferase